MDCREFRRKHDAYIDDTLSGVELEAMARHRRSCEPCGKLDTRVRRALLLAHNLPAIQPSRAFGARLQARLVEERRQLAAAGLDRTDAHAARLRPVSATTYTAIAAGLLAVVGLAGTAIMAGRSETTIRLAPVVASLPEPEPSSLATPEMVASMPAGMAVWPAVFVAQQAPWHLASDVVGR